jgi:hypothetical protein
MKITHAFASLAVTDYGRSDLRPGLNERDYDRARNVS